jgi:hypothetical protein
MKLSELRLGNWIMFSDSKYVGQFLQVELTFFQCYDITEEENELPFEGVLITPEILEKAGFENWDKNKYANDVMCLTLNGHGFLYLANQRHVNLFYLHQLQNLYFALTGEELTLDLCTNA